MNNVVDLIMCALTANLIDNSKLYNIVFTGRRRGGMYSHIPQ